MKQIYSNGLINSTEIYFLSQVNKSTQTYTITNVTNVTAILEVSDNLIDWIQLTSISSTAELDISKPFIRVITNTQVYLEYKPKNQTIPVTPKENPVVTTTSSDSPDMSKYLLKENLASEINKLLGIDSIVLINYVKEIAKTKDLDNDSLSDFMELFIHKTNPNSPDSDNDGFRDSDELRYNTNPNELSSIPSVEISDITILMNNTSNIQFIAVDSLGENIFDPIPAQVNIQTNRNNYHFNDLSNMLIDLSRDKGVTNITIDIALPSKSITKHYTAVYIDSVSIQSQENVTEVLTSIANQLRPYITHLEQDDSTTHVQFQPTGAIENSRYTLILSADDDHEEFINLFNSSMSYHYSLANKASEITFSVKDNVTNQSQLITRLS